MLISMYANVSWVCSLRKPRHGDNCSYESLPSVKLVSKYHSLIEEERVVLRLRWEKGSARERVQRSRLCAQLESVSSILLACQKIELGSLSLESMLGREGKQKPYGRETQQSSTQAWCHQQLTPCPSGGNVRILLPFTNLPLSP